MFSMPDGQADYARVYLSKKSSNSECAAAANQQSPASGYATGATGIPDVLCPATAGNVLLGYETVGTSNTLVPILVPNGAAYVYGLRNQTALDAMCASVERGKLTPDATLFTVSSADGTSTVDITYSEGLPNPGSASAATGFSYNFPITIATVYMQRTVGITGLVTSTLLSVDIQTEWRQPSFALKPVPRASLCGGSCVNAVGVPVPIGSNRLTLASADDPYYSYYDDTPDLNFTLAMTLHAPGNYSDKLGVVSGNVSTTELKSPCTSLPEYTGLGLIILVSADTTVDSVITTGRQPVTQFLGSMAGGFGGM